MKTVICTTGTSIAAGLDPKGVGSVAIRDRLAGLAEQQGGQGEYLVRACAESHSLYRMGLHVDDAVHLLHSDTKDGKTCAVELKALIEDAEELGQHVYIHNIAGLQMKDLGLFRREGIPNLFKRLDDISRPARDRGRHSDVWLNVTGGFKSVVPYMTLFGLLYQLRIVYIFERSDTLITLPPALINFDFERLTQVEAALRRLYDEDTMLKDDFFKAIPNLDHSKREWVSSLVEEVDGFVVLSAFGQLVSQAINPSLPSVHLSPNAQETYDRASGDVRRHFTVMLDRVAKPLWREQTRHSFRGTDLTVFKPGNTSERIAAYLHNEEVHVCELYQHDRYERHLPGRSISDYPLGSFRVWTKPADQQDLPLTEEEDYRRLEDDLNACRRQLTEAKQALAGARSERESVEVESRKKVERWRKRCGELERELEQVSGKPPWWKRVFRLPR